MRFFGLVFVVLLQLVHMRPNEKLKVSIYYEALCPDSYRFLMKEFCPSYESLTSSINIHLVPYGRASHKLKNNEWHFECQHGPQECFGNKIQACGIAQAKSQNDIVSFVCCMMHNYKRSAQPSQLQNCVHHLGTTSESILNCSHSTVGDELLVGYGNETHSLGYLPFIPTITFNDNLTQSLEIQESILHDFNSTAHEYLEPQVAHHNNSFSPNSNLSLVLLQVVIFTLVRIMQ